jgi:putative F0F1-ATPase subunit (Ca2+/Mg2+ transporter)
MPSVPAHSGEMSQNSARDPVHHSRVPTDALDPATRPAPPAPVLTPALDPAARASKRMYQGLSSSSVGLELGIAVILGLLFGMWLDRRLGTEPWMMLVFLVLGLIAGFRNVLRAVARAEKAGP